MKYRNTGNSVSARLKGVAREAMAAYINQYQRVALTASTRFPEPDEMAWNPRRHRYEKSIMDLPSECDGFFTKRCRLTGALARGCFRSSKSGESTTVAAA
jgi:hypothetical protein